MARRDLLLIVVLSVIWGASFMFIKVADRSFDPSALVWLRLLLGCAVMVPAALVFAGPRAILAARPYWWRIALLGFSGPGELLGLDPIDTFVHAEDKVAVRDFGRRRDSGEPLHPLRIRWMARDGRVVRTARAHSPR